VEKLIKNISKLIARNDCVIIPGVGAFLAHEVPASYNPEDKMFMPPHRALLFNPNIKVDDMLLLSEYLAGGKYSYSEALSALSKDTADFKKELSAKGALRFGELGTFSMNVKGEFSFAPNPNGIDDPYNFGFEPIAIPLLSQIDKKDIVIKRRNFKKYISIAVASVLTLFFISPIGDNAYTPSLKAGFVAVETASTVSEPVNEAVTINQCEIEPVADTVTENIITKSQTVESIIEAQPEQVVAVEVAEVPMAEPVVAEQPAEEHANIENENSFHIIVASTPNEEKAQLAIKELSAKMQAEYSVVKGNGRHRIAHSSYSSIDEANEALAQVKNTFPDAWVLTY
jgi:hypothetical protein